MSNIDVLFRNEDFLIVNKPVGLSVQCETGQPGCMAQLKSSLGAKQLHPVHRLDKVTSGLLIVACHSEANREFSQMFQRGEVTKYYYALSAKRPGKKQGSVVGDMCPARNGNWKLLRTRTQPAVTQFFSCGFQGLRFFILKPHTGKTHQLRVALKSLGAPILGDLRYGADSADRVYLHAAALSFTFAGEAFQFFQPPSMGRYFDNEHMTPLLQSLGAPHEQPWPKYSGKCH